MSDSLELICLPGMSGPQVGGWPLVESRSLENPAVSLSDADGLAEAFGWSIPSESGQPVNPGRALSLSAFWAAVKMISGDVSRLPMATFRRRPNGMRPIADDSHQLWRFLQPLGKANDELSTLKLWRRAMVHALVWENAYIWCDWSPNGRLRGMYNLLSDRTMVVRNRGELWVVTELGDMSTGGPKLVARPYDEVVHIEGLTIDGLSGMDMVYQARDDIGVALASRQFKSKFFAEGMHAGGILQVPPGAKPDNVRKVEDAIKEHHSTSNKAFRTLTLRDGFKWFNTQISPQQAEMVEMDETEIRNLCRRFMLQPGRLGVRESISYNSLDAEKRDYYDTTLVYWASIIRSELNVKCLTEAERREWIIDHNISLALLWADAATLIAVGVQGVNSRDHVGRSIFDADEVRAWFQLPERESEAVPESQEPPADDPSDEEDDDEEQQPGGSDANEDGDEEEAEADETRNAHRALLAAELRRLIRRLNVGTAKAAKRGQVGEWLTSGMFADMQALAVESLGPILAAARSVPSLRANMQQTGTVEDCAVNLLECYRRSLSVNLPMDWDDKDHANTMADTLAATWILAH